jgi:hypothetical protein
MGGGPQRVLSASRSLFAKVVAADNATALTPAEDDGCQSVFLT